MKGSQKNMVAVEHDWSPLTLTRGGGANMPYGYQKDYLSVTECRIYLKPGCNLKKNLLSRYLSKKSIGLDPGGPF